MIRASKTVFWALFVLPALCLSETNTFSGSLLLADHSIVPFVLELNIDSSFGISGFSYLGKEQRVKHMVEGSFSPEDHSIYIKELPRERIKDKCLIYIQGRIGQPVHGIFVIAGLFRSQDSAQCSGGHINVFTRQFIHPPRLFVPRFFTQDSTISLPIQSLLSQRIIDDTKFLPVSPLDAPVLKSNTDRLVLWVYDQLKIDKDRIQIRLNNTKIDNLELTANKKHYSLLLKKGVNSLSFIALNEGEIPSNTSKLEILLGSSHYFFSNILYTGQTIQYTVLYE